MPFTPLHMGPGMFIKAWIPRHFSIIVFGITQIAIDLEVLWRLARWTPPLHAAWHTYSAAILIGILCAVVGKPISQGIKIVWNRIAGACSDANLAVPVPTSWRASIISAFIGTFSHIAIDSLYHADLQPLQPWSATNPLRAILSPPAIDVICVVLGLIGLAWFFIRHRKTEVRHSQ